MDNLKERYMMIKSQIPEDVTLLAVSKTKPIEDIEAVYDLGHRDFAENKIQELKDKMNLLPKDIRWHFIGNLQTNKVKYLDERVELVQSLDRISLLEALDKNARKKGYIQKVLLEINIGREESKGGVLLDDLAQLVVACKEKENICVLGIMSVIPKGDETYQRKYFSELSKIFNRLKKEESDNFKMEILSMGMSNDFKIAIENGSNMVRVGRSIFGERQALNSNIGDNKDEHI